MSISDKLTTIYNNTVTINNYIDETFVALENAGVEIPEGANISNIPGMIPLANVSNTTTSEYYLNICTLTIDDGYQIERIPIQVGQSIDLSSYNGDVSASTNWGSYYHAKSHPAMTFQSWSSSIEISNNTFVVPDSICTDYHIGATYCTTDNSNYLIKFATGSGYSKETFEDSVVTTNYTSSSSSDDYYGNNDFTNQVTAVWLGSSVTSIGTYAFYQCISLTSINISDSVTSIGTCAFYGCYSLTSINIPDSVTSIGTYAFYQCISLTSINIPDSVTSIVSYAFQSIYSLASINIPDSVTSIGAYAFRYCYSLTSINIPDSVTSVGDYTFNGCYSLSAIILPETPPTLGGTNAFANCNCTFLVPTSAAITAYEAATNWSSFAGRFILDTTENRKLFGIW